MFRPRPDAASREDPPVAAEGGVARVEKETTLAHREDKRMQELKGQYDRNVLAAEEAHTVS